MNAKGLRATFDLKMSVNPNQVNKGKWMDCKRNYWGYVGPDAVNEWLSTACGRDVVLLYSPLDRLNTINKNYGHPFLQEGDQARAFNFDGALHMIGEASIKDLRARVIKRNPEIHPSKLNVEMENFRPNIVLKTSEPFIEDTLMEMRVGNLLIRTIGPTWRCTDTMLDRTTRTVLPENEPLSTLNSFRKHPNYGGAFGIYCVMAVVNGEVVYHRLFPREKGY